MKTTPLTNYQRDQRATKLVYLGIAIISLSVAFTTGLEPAFVFAIVATAISVVVVRIVFYNYAYSLAEQKHIRGQFRYFPIVKTLLILIIMAFSISVAHLFIWYLYAL